MKVPSWLRDTGRIDLGGGAYEWMAIAVISAIVLFTIWALYQLLFPV
jgi:hypothetical protein